MTNAIRAMSDDERAQLESHGLTAQALLDLDDDESSDGRTTPLISREVATAIAQLEHQPFRRFLNGLEYHSHQK